MEIITKEEMVLKIKGEYFDIFSTLTLITLILGAVFYSVSVSKILVLCFTSLFLFLFGGGTFLYYKKYKNKELLIMERMQSLVLEYEKNPHKFIKKYSNIQKAHEIEAIVIKIELECLEITNESRYYYYFESKYDVINSCVNINKKELIGWKS